MEENYSYLHFTNNDAFENIIRNKSFRLYNYESLSDKFEISLPLIILLKEIFYFFPGNTFNKNCGNDNYVFYFIFVSYLKKVKSILNNDDYDIVIDDIIENLNNNENSEIKYNEILTIINKGYNIHYENLGVYLLSTCQVNNDIISNYSQMENNLKFNKNKKNILSNSRIFSDMRLNNFWERYGNKHNGIAVNLSEMNMKVIKNTNNKICFKKVNYDIENNQISLFYYVNAQYNVFNIKNKITEFSKVVNENLINQFTISKFDDFKELFYNSKDFLSLISDLLNKFTDIINNECPFLKMKTFTHEEEFRLTVTKNIYDDKNIKNFKTDPIKNTNFYELSINDIFTEENPLEVIIGYRNEKFLNTSYRETFQREFPFVKFLM